DSSAALNWLAMEKPDLERVHAALLGVLQDGERAAKVLTHIRGMLSSRAAQPYHPCDIGTVIRETLALVRTEFARQAIRVQTSFELERSLVMGDAIQLQQVVLNLLLNAAEASRELDAERRCITVSTHLQPDEPR